MQSNAKDVTSYIEQADAERRVALLKRRELCQKYLTGFPEKMPMGDRPTRVTEKWKSASPARRTSSA
jgi:hypothetical protein